jgi:hypothetical protein
MSSFASLKKSSGNLDKLTKALEQINSNTQSSDSSEENFWRPEVDKAGNGYAVIRFLPAPAADGDDGIPWAKVYTHGFQGPGGWYIENSLTTLNEKDPVSEYNSELWNSGLDANKEIARKQKRRLTYISNILVIEDPKHPENNGQVKLFKYGKKIFDKITEAMNPAFEDEQPINPFDLWGGANFKLKIRKVEGYQNYDKSEFESASELFGGDDAKLEKLWQSEYSLKEFLDKKHFKSYDELKARLDKVLGSVAAPKSYSAPAQAAKPSTIESAKPTVEDSIPEIDTPWTNDEDDNSIMDHFAALANDD